MKIIDLHLSTFIVLYAIVLIISYTIYNKRKRQKFHTFYYWMLSELYYLLLIKVTILPIGIWNNSTSEQLKEEFSKTALVIQYIPFSRIEQYFYSFWGSVQLVGNIILLTPIVVMLVWFSKKRYSNKKIILGIFCISIGIEVTQYIINRITLCPSHVADINDIIFNVVGGILCLVVCRIIEKKFTIFPEKLRGIFGASKSV